jgi:hypothetical protein
MKFAATALAFASIFAAANAGKSGSSDEVEGEASISLGSEPCKLTCEWGANYDDDRRLLRGANEEIPFSIVDFETEHEHRKLFVALANVVCELDLGEEDAEGESITYSKEIPFPDGWTVVAKEADGADNFRGFAIGFTVRLYPGLHTSFLFVDFALTIKYRAFFVLQIEDGLGVPLAEGELEIEFTKGEIVDDKGKEEDIVVFDDHAIGVSCL